MLNVGKISRAVTDCLDRCYVSSSPLASVAEYVTRLSRDPEWSAYEVESVEMRVIRVLSRIVRQPTNEREQESQREPTTISVRVNPADFSAPRTQNS
jgi:hypothetical protein